jgi:hypothetical protein
MAQTCRISTKSDVIIHQLVALTGKDKTEIIEQALELYRYRERMRLFNEAYSRLKPSRGGCGGSLNSFDNSLLGF